MRLASLTYTYASDDFYLVRKPNLEVTVAVVASPHTTRHLEASRAFPSPSVFLRQDMDTWLSGQMAQWMQH